MKIFFIGLSVMLLVYMLWPAPTTLAHFNEYPTFLDYIEDWDFYVSPHTTSYFSNDFREEIVTFYRKSYQQGSKLPFPPLKLNYPPELAFSLIKDQTKSTYLEEFVYPLRDSIYINGFEPFLKNGQKRYEGAKIFEVLGEIYLTKTTVRFYPSPIWIRIIVWFGIVISCYFLWKLSKRVITNA